MTESAMSEWHERYDIHLSTPFYKHCTVLSQLQCGLSKNKLHCCYVKTLFKFGTFKYKLYDNISPFVCQEK